MTWEERWYDKELMQDWPKAPRTKAQCCPECGAKLDSDEDELYQSKEGDYILGCSHCVAVRPAAEEEWQE